jgi:outer membrane receptor protein involved in Fe transport
VNLLDKKCGLWAALVLRCRAAHLLPAASVAIVGVLASAPAAAQGNAVLTGTVVDTATKRPLADVVVTVTSPALQGEQTVVTDKSGSYRIPNLPPGDYTLRLEGDAYKPYSRGGITMRANATIRVNAELLPEGGIQAAEVVVVGKAPTVDVGSSSTGVTLNQDFVSRIALNPPGGKAAASRSFESLATVAPGAQSDGYGVSIAGTTSPENAFVIDGVGVNDPAFGINATPLSVEFVKELGVITGGYLPEYGKATGGIFDVVTKSGSNEFHGSVFFNVTPGAIEGPRTPIKSAATTITTNPSLSSLRDFGAEIGGPIMKDKLWFYAGLQFAFNRQKLERNLSQFNYVKDKDGNLVQAVDKDGFPVVTPITCPAGQTCNTGPDGSKLPAGVTIPASPVYYSEERSIQFIGKLTYLINQDHNITLSVIGTPTRSGGNGTYPFDNTGGPAIGNIIGPYQTLGGQYISDSYDTSLKYQGAFNNKRQLLDITAGWHHQHQATLAADGTGPGDVANRNGLAGLPEVIYRRGNASHDYHSITDFETIPNQNIFCQPVMVSDGMGGTVAKNTCPVTSYALGGPGFIDDVLLDSAQARAVFTNLVQAAGHHVIKAGIDFSYNIYRHQKAYSGGEVYRESKSGASFSDYRKYGFQTGPDQVQELDSYTAKTSTASIGAFVQDSWQIFDKVTLNIGVRYDAQYITGADGALGLALPNQWSPRVGIIYDFTQQGRSKLYANFARYYEGVPLDMADRSFPSEPQIVSVHSKKGGCDPATSAGLAGCSAPSMGAGDPGGARLPITSTNDPSQYWYRTGGSKEPVDPNVSPQSSDEFVVGGEYEIFSDARLGISYTHRYLNKAIEDMSRDEGNTYFIGNPGYGIAKDFPKAVRNYDAMTLYFQKNYANTWLFNASYTLSRLYGNYAGLFRPETGQLHPNITSDFDLRSLLTNRLGPLPGDSTHSIKLYGAKDFLIPGGQDILIGLTYRARSGAPLNALGSHNVYGAGEVYLIPRGTGGTLNAPGDKPSDKDYTVNQARGDWTHTIDLRLGYSVRLNKDSTLGITMDVFNIFNFQAATGRDQNYTTSDVLPCAKGGTVPTCVRHQTDSTPFDPKTEVNPNYGKPVAYQDPRQFRFGAKVTF